MSLEHSQFGHYQLLQHIDNETGAVYLARDVRASRQVAVKMLRIDDMSQDSGNEIIRRIEDLFEHEIKNIACLDHPHILPVLASGFEKIENTLYAYVVMPYRSAGSLASWLTQASNDSCLPLSTIASLLVQTGEALHHAHEYGVLHQDIKPTNILLSADPSQFGGLPDLLLSDFSIARLFATNSSQGLSQSSYVRGTYLFLAPEQWDGKSVPASDQYALAILAFYLLTGKYPFYGSLSQVIRQHHQTPAPAPGSLNPRLDPAIDNIIQRALAKEPQKRFPSILDFAQAFAPFQGLADAVPLSHAPSNVAALSGQSPTLLPEQPVQRSQTSSPIAAPPLAQGLSQDVLATPSQREAAAISPVLPVSLVSTEATSIASKRAQALPDQAPVVAGPAQPSPDQAPDETLIASKSALLARLSPDATLIAGKRAQASPDQVPVVAGVAQPSFDETLIASKHAQASPNEKLIASKPDAVSTGFPIQASPDATLIATRPTQIASASVALFPNKSTEQTSLPDARQSSATPEANGRVPVDDKKAQSPATPPIVLAENAVLSETLLPVLDGVAPTVLAENAVAPVLNGSAPPLPILQFHEPQMQFQLPAIQRKSVSTGQKSLVIALIVLVVLAASGAFLFKSLAGHDVSAAKSQSNVNSSQAHEITQAGQPLSGAGGINVITVTPTSTNGQTPTTGTSGSQPGSTPGSRPGSTPSATSTHVPGGSTGPTAQPTTAPAAQPTAIPTPKPAPPTPTPTPHGCDTSSWSSTLSPTYSAGGTEHFVSSYCRGVVSLTWTAAPPSGGHQVEAQICYGQRTSNCSAWVAYTGVNVWYVVATGRSSGQGFYINNRCQACSGSAFKIYGSIKY